MDDLEKKILNCNETIKANPNDPSGYYDRGWLKLEMNDYAGAKSDFSKAITLNSSNPDYYYGRGISLRYLEDYTATLTDCSIAIDIDPSFSEAYNLRGKTKMSLKNYRDAILDFTKAIEIKPAFEFAYANRGLCKQALGDYEGAIEDISIAIEIYPASTEFCNYLDIAKEEYYAAKGTSSEKEDDNHFYDRNSTTIHMHETLSNIDYNKNFEIVLNVVYKHPDEAFGFSFRITTFPGQSTSWPYWLEVWSFNVKVMSRWPLITNNFQNPDPDGLDLRNINKWSSLFMDSGPMPLSICRTDSSLLGRWEPIADTNSKTSYKF
jgi:tetratricopeptide (TPR) repeat protein